MTEMGFVLFLFIYFVKPQGLYDENMGYVLFGLLDLIVVTVQIKVDS
jgi:hypothetical protein